MYFSFTLIGNSVRNFMLRLKCNMNHHSFSVILRALLLSRCIYSIQKKIVPRAVQILSRKYTVCPKIPLTPLNIAVI